ncbi:MAG: hypothetical protein PHS64_04135, partial [Candidatus Omnitrophica bacterium]|nr:hypothetical protein [Candidatus Omnitrophota bacterium]
MLNRTVQDTIILLEEGNRLSWKTAGRYDRVYVYSGDFRNATRISDDIMNQEGHHSIYYRAGREIDRVYGHYAGKDETGVLNEIFKDERAHAGIKKTVLLALGGLFHSLRLAENFIRQYNIREPIDFIPASFPYSLYRIVVEKKGLLSERIRIPEEYIRAMKRREGVMNAVSRAKLIAYPVWILLNMGMRLRAPAGDRKYRYGICVWNSWIDSAPAPCRMDFLTGEDCLGPENALYIIDGPVTKQNLSKVRGNGYPCLYFKNMIREYSGLSYLKRMFGSHLKACAQCFSLCRHNKSVLAQSYLRAMQSYILWEVFCSLYTVERFITLQEPGNVYRTLIQKNHGAKCLFVFWSTSYDIVYREDDSTHTDSYYSHMVYDEAISSLMSNEYLKRNNNIIGRYVNVGMLRSDGVFRMRHDAALKSAMKKELGIPADKKIIGFFDTTVGRTGMFTNHEGLKMLEDVYRFLDSSPECFMLFRTRGHYELCDDDRVRKSFARLIGHPRVLCINTAARSYYAYDVMGVCDLVIGAFTGSAPLESVAGGVRTLCYTPERFKQGAFVITSFPGFCVSNFIELKNNADYWLYRCGEDDFSGFQ